jgi:hypothetical protein
LIVDKSADVAAGFIYESRQVRVPQPQGFAYEFQWHIVAVDAEGAPQPESKAMIVGK